jgi:hypothetical protein
MIRLQAYAAGLFKPQWSATASFLAFMAFMLFFPFEALAHGVTAGDKGYIQETTGVHPLAFIYLGAKHMMTGYDHLLFLFGVIFFLYRLKDVGIYVTLFAVGHVITLLSGVLLQINISAYIIDAIIGFSVVYKALDNMGAFQRWFGFQPNTKVATLIFGLFHGFGLATKILEYEISPDGLLANLIFFNIGCFGCNPDCHQLLAKIRKFSSPRLQGECLHDDAGLSTYGLPDHRLFRLLKSLQLKGTT